MSAAVAWALAAASPLVLLPAAYLLLLTLLSRRPPPPRPAPSRLRFDLVVPAHDEEAGISATVESLLAVDWPAAQRRVVVVADNCQDATAARAFDAGATVLVRESPLRGKGHALAHAFAWCLRDAFADAIVVVDADTVVSANLLRAFAARLEAGALAVQAEYGVRNPDAGRRTRLMAIAFALFHQVRSVARERMGVSAGLRGNGMCFAARLLRAVPHEAFSIVEDVEYGLLLALAGHRVRYAGEARVLGEMPSSAAGARSQRRRWEGGRARLLRVHGPALLSGALRRRDLALLDLAADLAVPPLAGLAAAAVAGTAAAAAASWAAGEPIAALFSFGGATLALAAYVVRGWWLSGTGLRGAAALAWAPAYLLWKIGIALRSPDDGGAWIRTAREPRAQAPPRGRIAR